MNTKSQSRLTLLLVWTSFYEQLSWSPILVLFAVALEDSGALALAVSAYSVANLIGNLFCGHLADRFGRYRMAGIGLLGLVASSFLHLAISSPAGLVLTRLLHGLFASAVAPSTFAALSEQAPAERRGEFMAKAGMWIAVASMMAPALAGRVAESIGLGTLVTVQALALLVIGLVTVRLQDPRRTLEKTAQTGKESEAEGWSEDSMRLRAVAFVCAAGFAIMFAQGVLFYAFPLKTTGLGLGSGATGAMFSIFGLGAMAAFAPPLSRLSDKWGRARPIAVGLTLSSVGYILISFNTSSIALGVSMLVYALGFGLAFPAVSAANVDASGARRRGAAFGYLTAAFSAGAVAGPLVTRALEDVASPFIIAALVLMVGVGATPLGIAKAALGVSRHA